MLDDDIRSILLAQTILAVVVAIVVAVAAFAY